MGMDAFESIIGKINKIWPALLFILVACAKLLKSVVLQYYHSL